MAWRLNNTHVVHFFENSQEYCTFVKWVMTGPTKHTFVSRATFPSIYGGEETGYIGYAERYHGMYGDGWRFVIYRPRNTKIKGGYNHLVKYFIESNQLDARKKVLK